MRRVRIFAKALSASETTAIRDLAAKAGFSFDEIEVVPTVGEPLPDCDDEIVLVLLTPAACADPDLDQELAKTPNGGRRAICVWPQNENVSSEPPDAAKKYGYSIVPWDADKLQRVSADDDVLCFETPSGQPLPKVPTERHLCVEDEA